MARLKTVVHSQDACTLVFKGDKRNPEPTYGIIKFPGGSVEVARCSDNESYWVHIHIDDHETVEDSRVDYEHETYLKTEGKIPPIPYQDKIDHIAVRIRK